MADPICRWRNSSVKQLLEYNDLFPYQEQSSEQARNTIESRWSILGGKDFFTTPYQLAAQMAMYYEDKNHFYPRLNRKLSIEEARDYMNTWAKLYYAPNPYSPSMNLTERPVIINNFLVNWCIDNENASFKDALKSMFREQIGNVDILVNMLNNFSEVHIDGDKLTLKDSAPLEKYEIVELSVDKNDKKGFFDHFSLCYPSSQSIIEHSETKTLLFESSVVVEFMGKALQEYLKEDNLNAAISQMNANASTLGFTGCRFAKLKSWFDSQTDTRRKDDCDTSIVIGFDDNTYYFYKEQSGSTLNVFADKMNGIYTGVFLIEIDAAGKYRMYRLASAKPKLDFPLQQIFYGAPGTGKSNSIKREVEDKGRIHFRTTFHPDSDYSTFVGCYKPTTSKGKAESKIYSKEELVNILKQIKESGISYPYHKFAYKYWKSVKSLTTAEKKEVLSEAGSSENYSVEFDKAAILGEEYSNTSSTITYQFVPQAFTKAYCEAWNNYKPEGESEPVFLIIEEINRGNCAQIFGDIFQLLDRETERARCGFSTYPIDADEDLKKFLLNGIKEDGTPWLSNKDGIQNGQLCLPPNLHIWATMNTSDQSLFPIDSAFKRRWDWKYVPIDYDKETWSIVTKDEQYSWSDFLKKINNLVASTTKSEDKMLGFYFAKAKNGIIDADTFVGKVVFYLWNDVFKDYGLPKEILNGAESKEFAFRNFFIVDGHANEDIVKRLLDNLGVAKTTDANLPAEDTENQDEA